MDYDQISPNLEVDPVRKLAKGKPAERWFDDLVLMARLVQLREGFAHTRLEVGRDPLTAPQKVEVRHPHIGDRPRKDIDSIARHRFKAWQT